MIRSLSHKAIVLAALPLLFACGSSSSATKGTTGDGPDDESAHTDDANLTPAEAEAKRRRALKDSDFVESKVEEVKAPVYLAGITREAQDSFRDGVRTVAGDKPNYTAAEEKFKLASEQDPTFMEAYFNWGMVLERTGRADDALGIYQKALQKNPDDASASAYIAKIYIAKARQAQNFGKKEESRQWLTKAKSLLDGLVAKDPNNVAVNNAMALYYLSLDDVETAERYVKEVLYVQPSNVTGLNTRGLINLKQGKYLIAKWIFENKVLREDPTSTEALTNLGHTYIKLDQRPLAMRQFQKALEFDANNMEVRMNIAAMLLEHLDYKGALGHYDKILVAQPNNGQAKIGRCDALFGISGASGAADAQKTALGTAIGCYNQFLGDQPQRTDLYKRIADTYWNKLQDLDNSIKYYELYGQKAKLDADARKKNDGMVKTLKDIKAKGGLKAMMGEPEPPPPAEEPGDDGGTPAPEGGEEPPASDG